MNTTIRTLVIVLTAILSHAAQAQEFHPDKKMMPGKKLAYSPYADDHFPQRVLWGDTHHHTSFSFDGGLMGTKLTPEDGFRFARGEAVKSSTGLDVKLIRPLDFLVVTDHAEYLGLADLIATDDPELLANEHGRRWHKMFKTGSEEGFKAAAEVFFSITRREELLDSVKLKRTVWERATAIAEKYNEPGHFTAFIGYEWTSAPGGSNLHRCVIFRDGADRANQIVPFSAFDSSEPEDLWEFLESYEKKTGGQVLAIPHNGNASNGRMFALIDSAGKPLTLEYAQQRMRWEPLVEVTQTKGDGEAHPALSAEDEFADFETWDFGNFANPVVPKEPKMLQYEYARSALKVGLSQGRKLGYNPFKFGMVGSTDTHTALSTTREENFFGKLATTEPSAERASHRMLTMKDGSKTGGGSMEQASGLAGVWARENTRASIFDAIARKEVYATTGTRITVRVFAGWDFAEEDVKLPDFARQGYARGVPMGGDLRKAPVGKAPTFMIRSLRDPDGANLDRIQLIKGWLDAAGKTHEKIYDVAVTGNRKIGPDGRCKDPVGNTADVANATYSNSIGSALLGAFWKDPDFDPKQDAFYYVRVIEIPTPRWTAYDANRFGITMPEDVPMTVQDRAYTSPIWYTP